MVNGFSLMKLAIADARYGPIINYFCDSMNNIEFRRGTFFQASLFVIRVPNEKNSDTLLGSENKREI